MAAAGNYLDLTLTTTGIVSIRLPDNEDPQRALEDFTKRAGRFSDDWIRDDDGEMIARAQVVSATTRRVE
jgi:hypothetical protein